MSAQIRPTGRPIDTLRRRRRLAADMARALIEADADLGDERAALLCLAQTHGADDVHTLLDDALAHARGLHAALARPGE